LAIFWSICYSKRMQWDTRFWKPIRLKNGRKIETLGEARDLIHALPKGQRLDSEWQLAAELLARASEATSLADDALSQLVRALRAEELI
jgi:hypothetical protein